MLKHIKEILMSFPEFTLAYEITLSFVNDNIDEDCKSLELSPDTKYDYGFPIYGTNLQIVVDEEALTIWVIPDPDFGME